jgi:hypothetical protein
MSQQTRDADIYRSAGALFRRYGREAPTIADMQATDELRNGDMEAYRRWKRIVLVIDVMLVGDSTDDVVLH